MRRPSLAVTATVVVILVVSLVAVTAAACSTCSASTIAAAIRAAAKRLVVVKPAVVVPLRPAAPPSRAVVAPLRPAVVVSLAAAIRAASPAAAAFWAAWAGCSTVTVVAAASRPAVAKPAVAAKLRAAVAVAERSAVFPQRKIANSKRLPSIWRGSFFYLEGGRRKGEGCATRRCRRCGLCRPTGGELRG
jgi:hypothetical protein